MRSEREMIDLIVNTAVCDERIRVVIMNGSRANPNAPRDRFQDFDIVYFVTEVTPFRLNLEWIERFGERIIMQMPEDMQDPPPAGDGGFSCLMQFTDSNRIDLGIRPLSELHEKKRDSLSLLLLDKDGLLDPLPAPDETDYLPKPPNAKVFSDCCNEFWWISPYVAKGLWRRQIVYAKSMLDQVARQELVKMLIWHIGVRTRFSRNPGKMGKYFEQFLEPELWGLLMRTYADAGYDNTWEALFTMCSLFRKVALHVSGHFGFEYPMDEDAGVSAYLEQVRFLPPETDDTHSNPDHVSQE